MKVDSKVMFATMKPWKLFFVVALPGVVSMFAMSVYSLIEGVFLGQKLINRWVFSLLPFRTDISNRLIHL